MRDMIPRFIFADGQSVMATKDDLVIHLPGGIRSEEDLCAHYEARGLFPAYFGSNWDALLDCLRDFSWIDQRRIVIVHRDLPFDGQEDELLIYLQILDTAIRDWVTPKEKIIASPPGMHYVEHELIVVFPRALERRISHVLRNRPRSRTSVQ